MGKFQACTANCLLWFESEMSLRLIVRMAISQYLLRPLNIEDVGTGQQKCITKHRPWEGMSLFGVLDGDSTHFFSVMN